MSGEANFFSDPIVWYSVALVVFLLLAYAKLRKPILGWLDGEIVKISNELDHASRLRAEAQALLADYRARQESAVKEAEAIIAYAKEEAARVREFALAELKVNIQRREQQALGRIRLAEMEAVAEVRGAIVEQALVAARNAMATGIDSSVAVRLADKALAEVPVMAEARLRADRAA